MKRVSVKAVALMGGLALALVGCSSQASSPSSSPPVASSPSASPSGANADVAASSANFTISATGTTTGIDPFQGSDPNGGNILGGTISGSTGKITISGPNGTPMEGVLTGVTVSGSPNSQGSTLASTWKFNDMDPASGTLSYQVSGPAYSGSLSGGSTNIGVQGLTLVPVVPTPAAANFTIPAGGTTKGIDPFQSSDPNGGNILGGKISGSTGTIKISGPNGTPMKGALTGVTVSGSPNSTGSTLTFTWTFNDMSPASGTLSYQVSGPAYSGTLSGGSTNITVQGLTLVPAA